MEKYLIEINQHNIILEYRSKGELSDKNRRAVVKYVAEFMLRIFGNKPTKAQKVMTAKSVIALFPCLEVKNSEIGGIVSLEGYQCNLSATVTYHFYKFIFIRRISCTTQMVVDTWTISWSIFEIKKQMRPRRRNRRM